MRNKLGSMIIIAGVMLILSALSLFLYNHRENKKAEEQSETVLQIMLDEIAQNQTEGNADPNAQKMQSSADEKIPDGDAAGTENDHNESITDNACSLTDDAVEPESVGMTKEEWIEDTKMKTATIDGNSYIGYLLIEDIGLQLPIMSDWNEEKLKSAPCRYTGSVWSDDLVIAGHNYRSHFSSIKNLSLGEDILFVDLYGEVHEYRVVAMETLEPEAVDEMTSGAYDLTLFTCTYGGANRATIRCNRVWK